MVKNSKNPAQTRKTFATLAKVYGIIFLLSTIATTFSLINVADFLAHSTHVDGQVIDVTRDSKGRLAPTVRFKTADGQLQESKSNIYSSPGPNVGDSVKIVYRTSDPQDWQIDDWIYVYFWTLFGSIFMFAWGIATVATMLKSRSA